MSQPCADIEDLPKIISRDLRRYPRKEKKLALMFEYGKILERMRSTRNGIMELSKTFTIMERFLSSMMMEIMK